MILKGDPNSGPQKIHNVNCHFTRHGKGLVQKIRFQKLLKQIAPDFCIQQSIGSVTKEVGFFCMWHPCKFIYWIGSDKDIDPNLRDPKVRRGFWFDWGFKRAHYYIAQTKHQQNILKDTWKKKSTIIRNGFPFRPRPERKRDIVLWVGRFVPVKRPELFIALAKSIPEERFYMIGPVTNQVSQECFSEIAPLMKGVGNLEYNSGVSLDEIGEYFDRAKVLVNTSILEGFPNTFVQAMWSGTPIASYNFDADGLIAERELGCGPVSDLDRFTESIRRLLNDQDRWTHCSINARTLAEDQFNIKINTERLYKLLQGLFS